MFSCLHYIGDEDGRSHSEWNVNSHTNACVSVLQARRLFYAEPGMWPHYGERMLCYFEARGITDEIQNEDILFSLVGARTCRLMRNLTSAVKPRERSLTDLMEALFNYYSPKPCDGTETVIQFEILAYG